MLDLLSTYSSFWSHSYLTTPKCLFPSPTSLYPSLPPPYDRLIGTMLIVDPANRASLEQVAAHSWLKSDIPVVNTPYSLPPFSSLEEIPEDILQLVLSRLEMGGYGSKSTILK